MGGVGPKFGFPGSRRSFTCAAAITGGQVVERRTGTDLVGPAAAGSTVVCGVAMHDVPASRAYVGGPAVGDGHELTVIRNCVIPVTAAGAIAVGKRVKAGAAGTVSTWVSGTDAADLIIGEAEEAIADTATGLVRIY